MIAAYHATKSGLVRLELTDGTSTDGALQRLEIPVDAIWIDLLNPSPVEEAAVSALGATVPTLAEMEEIEISNRLYHEDGADVMTVVVPGQDREGRQIAAPFAFILSPERLVTVRHHALQAFDTYLTRAPSSLAGFNTPEQVFLGIVEEIDGRLADLLEGAGRVLDEISRGVFGGKSSMQSDFLGTAMERVGQQGELVGRVRLAMLTLERALSFYMADERSKTARDLVRGELRDLKALAVHADYLMARVGLTVDATLGMINLAQSTTIRIVSVVTMLFLPPTLVASIYGMNFPWMPFLENDWGFLIASGLMLASVVGTWGVFKHRGWL